MIRLTLLLLIVSTNVFGQNFFPFPLVGVRDIKSITLIEQNRERIPLRKVINNYNDKVHLSTTYLIEEADTCTITYENTFELDKETLTRQTTCFLNNKKLFNEYYAITNFADTIFYRKMSDGDTVLYRDYFYNQFGALEKIEVKNIDKRLISVISVTNHVMSAGKRAEIYHKKEIGIADTFKLSEILVKEFDRTGRLFKVKYFSADSIIQQMDIFFYRTRHDFFEIPHHALSCFSENLTEAQKNADKNAIVDALERNILDTYRKRIDCNIVYYKSKRRQ